MKNKKMILANGEEILRWGYRTKGMFTIQEFYYIKSTNLHSIIVPLWQEIWAANIG